MSYWFNVRSLRGTAVAATYKIAIQFDSLWPGIATATVTATHSGLPDLLRSPAKSRAFCTQYQAVAAPYASFVRAPAYYYEGRAVASPTPRCRLPSLKPGPH